MKDCKWTTRISAYHDGEVGVDEQRAIEAHLRGCEECRIELEAMQMVSGAFSGLRSIELPNDAKQRLHAAVDRAQLRLIERLAGALGALAATVAIVAVLWSSGTSNTATAAGPTEQWEQAAIQLTLAERSGTEAEMTTAEWVLNDLSSGESNVD